MKTETIIWQPIKQGLPDSDESVLVSTVNQTGEGYHNGEEWRWVSNDSRILERVLGWATMPVGLEEEGGGL